MAKTLTKDQLVNAVAEKADKPVSEVHAILQGVVETIQEALVAGRKVELRNFGIFRPVVRKARKGRDPRDPSRVYDVPAKCAVKFKAGAHFNALLNPAPPEAPPAAVTSTPQSDVPPPA